MRPSVTRGGEGKEGGMQLEEPGRASEGDAPEAIFEGLLGNQGSKAVGEESSLLEKLA